jgi:hypothetical protein
LDTSFYLLTAFAVSALFLSFGLEAKQKVGY